MIRVYIRSDVDKCNAAAAKVASVGRSRFRHLFSTALQDHQRSAPNRPETTFRRSYHQKSRIYLVLNVTDELVRTMLNVSRRSVVITNKLRLLIPERRSHFLLSGVQRAQSRHLSSSSRRLVSPPANDPWAKREAWRHSPEFGKMKQLSKLFPGFTLGAAAFGVYLAWDMMTGESEKEHGHH